MTQPGELISAERNPFGSAIVTVGVWHVVVPDERRSLDKQLFGFNNSSNLGSFWFESFKLFAGREQLISRETMKRTITEEELALNGLIGALITTIGFSLVEGDPKKIRCRFAITNSGTDSVEDFAASFRLKTVCAPTVSESSKNILVDERLWCMDPGVHTELLGLNCVRAGHDKQVAAYVTALEVLPKHELGIIGIRTEAWSDYSSLGPGETLELSLSLRDAHGQEPLLSRPKI